MIRLRFSITIMAIGLVMTVLCIGCDGNSNNSNSETSQDNSYQGSWVRQGLYTDGELIDTIPVKLLFTRTAFNAAGMCSIAGKMDADGNTVHMIVQSSTCQGFSPGMEYNSTYELSGNGDVMTTWTDRQGAEIKEVYHRKAD
ncbi:MAG: hypothetical protein HOC20_10215 [Chloroflexi bacterium]|nr:hypothetical protein [Chloroflexota bacterium]